MTHRGEPREKTRRQPRKPGNKFVIVLLVMLLATIAARIIIYYLYHWNLTPEFLRTYMCGGIFFSLHARENITENSREIPAGFQEILGNTRSGLPVPPRTNILTPNHPRKP
jgi:hypothetical protein